ncbi:MAG: HD domain-containing protein [Candidatus Micrarchaeaceae archaeon]
MYIRDPLLGNIILTNLEKEIISTKYMQRLNYVRQLGFVYLVYPSANNSRFEHSLGTMQITKEIAKNVFKRISSDELEELACGALLHDIGHGPFSHVLDEAVKKYLKKDHVDIGEEIVENTEIGEMIEKKGLSIREVVRSMHGLGRGGIIGGSLGSDRIDYLLRDSYHIGVAYGVIDYNRIKNKIAFDKEPVIYEEAIEGAESMLIARYFMFTSVYNHHTSVIASEMFKKALDGAITAGEFDPKELSTLTDYQLMYRLSQYKESRDIIARINERRLFKRVIYKDISGIKNPKSLLNEVAEELESGGIGQEDFVTTLVEYKSNDNDMPVIDKKGKKIGMLSEMSPLVNTLIGMLNNRKKMLVASSPETRKKAERIASKIVDISK